MNLQERVHIEKKLYLVYGRHYFGKRRQAPFESQAWKFPETEKKTLDN